MKVTVLGAGVIGVTTAYYLARRGCQVTVIERQSQAAAESSFANAGQISPGYATPWAAPGVPLKALKWMFQKHAPLAIRPDGSLFQLQWLWQMLLQCRAEPYAMNKERLQRVAHYSRECLESLRGELRLNYEGRQLGTLQLFRSQKQLENVEADMSVLRNLGIKHRLLAPNEIAAVEPGLQSDDSQLKGALHLPGDETGDCRLFTQQLAARCEQLGVKFRYNTRVERIVKDSSRIQSVVINGVREPVQQLVIALGSFSRQILLDTGLSLPVYPLKGYSITVPIIDERKAPKSTVIDETYKVAVTRFDQRIRVGGMAEVAGFDARLNPDRRGTLEFVLNGLYKGAGDISAATFWTGFRPKTPDSTPIIGATPLNNLWLNTGHGTLGWTMACGSGRLLGDLITGTKTDISTEGLGLNRYMPSKSRALPSQPLATS